MAVLNSLTILFSSPSVQVGANAVAVPPNAVNTITRDSRGFLDMPATAVGALQTTAAVATVMFPSSRLVAGAADGGGGLGLRTAWNNVSTAWSDGKPPPASDVAALVAKA